MLLLERENPFRRLVATIEDDGRVVYLYVHHVESREFGMKALWLANCVAAPEHDDGARPPRLPRGATRFPAGRTPGTLTLEWLEDGESLVVHEDGALFAALLSGVPVGFARDAMAATAWAAPLDDATRNALEGAVVEARATWARWRDGAAAWAAFRDPALASLEGRLGAHAEYLAAGGDRFPPLAVARFAFGDAGLFVTVGMRLFPMPGAPAGRARTEIALAVRGDARWAAMTLAWLARYPWEHGVFLGDGHVVVAPGAAPTWFAPDASAVALFASPSADLPVLPTTLWALPISADERRTIAFAGSAALRARRPSLVVASD